MQIRIPFFVIIWCSLIASLSLFSCGNKSNTAGPEELKAGVVIDTVKILSHKEITYALFLPKNYTADTEWPLIICFDPHANGKLPVKLLSTQADQYGFIVAGSNNSRNGMPLQGGYTIYHEMLTDLDKHFNINNKAIYTAGFSGGARVAAGIAMELPGVAGVVACGAGLPRTSAPPGNPFSYLGVVGWSDFNFLEMKEQSRMLRNAMYISDLIVYDGIHQWPPEEITGLIFNWLQLDMMRNKAIPADRLKLDQYIERTIQVADSLYTTGRYMEVLEQYNHLRNHLQGLTNIQPIEEEIAKLEQHSQVLQNRQRISEIYTEEKSLQEKYAPLIAEKGPDYWKSEAGKLHHLAASAPDFYRQRMYSRVLAFLSLNSYMLADNALKSGNLAEAERFIGNYRLVDPPNSEHRYMAAVLKMKLGKRKEAIDCLNETIKLGFNDFPRLKADPVFNEIRNDEGYKVLLPK